MKALVLGLAAGIVATSAYAADLPTKAPAVAPAPVFVAAQWTGFYAGVHGGGAWGSNVGQGFNDTNNFGFVNPDFGGTRRSSAIGGVQFGYNWQFSPFWVVGVEGDFSWTSLNNSNSMAPVIGGFGAVPTTSVSMSNDVHWLASARGRFGYAWDRALLYVTGGAAWVNVSYSSALIALGPTTAGASFTKTQSGWVLGPGIEWLFTPNWALRGEYLYYSFPSASASTVFVPFCPGCTKPVYFNWSKGNVQVLRVGLNYKF